MNTGVKKIFDRTRTITGDSLERFVNHIARCLIDHGCKPGEAVGIYASIDIDSVLLLLATMRLGLTVAICPTREPNAVISDWLRSLAVKKLFTTTKLCGLDDIEQAVHHIFVDQSNSACVDRSDQFVSIIRTSGTSGNCKSAVIESRAHMASAHSVNNYFHYGPDDCFALSLPLYHVSGLSILFRSLLARSSIFVANNYQNLCLGLAQKFITHISLVPTQLARLLDDGVSLHHVKKIIIGGDAMPAHLRKRCLALNLNLYETYGLTETASMIWVKRSGCDGAGIVLPHAIMSFAPDQEILVGGESLFAGYVHDPLPKKQGLFATGDVGHAHGDCDLRIIERKSNRIISGGENIQAEEIERILDSHPLINDSVVMGVADEQFGCVPRAFIRFCGEPLSPDQLRSYLEKRIAAHKIPKSFCLWPAEAPTEYSKKPRGWFVRNCQ